MSNPERVIHSSINEVQEQSGASYATIIRFCKRLGYTGFKELKSNLAYDTHQDHPVTSLAAGFQIEQSDSTESIINKTFRSSIQTLQESEKIVHSEEVNRACNRILDAGTVSFIGTGTSGICANYAASRFFRIGINCLSETDSTLYKLKASILEENDVLFAISSSGRSSNIVDAARIARERNVSVISLCDFAISPLTKVSTINLYTTPRNTTQFSEMDVQLFIAQINIIDILFFKCCTEISQDSIELLNRTKAYSDMEKV